MKREKKCFYCEQNEDFQKVLFKVCELEVSTVFLCKDQTLPGRCTIMFRKHYDELYEIPKDDRDKYMDDVCALAHTIQELFGAEKINYAIYGDEVTHVHFTLCPKYREKLGWGKPFILFPEGKDKIILTEEEYRERIELIGSTVKRRRGCQYEN